MTDLMKAIEIGLNELRTSMVAPHRSVLHKALPAMRPSEAISWSNAQVFCVGYDAAKLLRERFRDEDIGDECVLPFNRCVFEFHVGGFPLLALRVVDGQQNLLCLLWQSPTGWLTADFAFSDGQWRMAVIDEETRRRFAADPLTEVAPRQAAFQFTMEQIFAVCIFLELGLFEMETIATAPRVNRERTARGKETFFDFHVLVVGKRVPSATANRPAGASYQGVRLHIRRGHHHHFHTRNGLVKRWIKPVWVGNPELGFVDKHYRLVGAR